MQRKLGMRIKIPVLNAAGEVREVDTTEMLPSIIVGGPSTSLVERLNAAERQAMDAWANQQQPGENGTVDLLKWPGWVDEFARAQRESKTGQ